MFTHRRPAGLVLALLVTVAAAVGSGFGDPAEPAGRLLLRTELFSWSALAARGRDLPGFFGGNPTGILRVDLDWNRVRVGTSLGEQVPGFDADGFLPVRLGYSIWERPRPVTWRYVAFVPELRAEATGWYWTDAGYGGLRIPFAARLDWVLGMDFAGWGADLTAGILTAQYERYVSRDRLWLKQSFTAATAGIRLRAITFTFDLLAR